MKTYRYEGPLYRKNRNSIEMITMYTRAKSAEQALNNFYHRVGDGCDLLFCGVQEVDGNYSLNGVEGAKPRKCDACGNWLMDNGECPLCGGGEYMIPDECLLVDNSEEIDYTDSE